MTIQQLPATSKGADRSQSRLWCIGFSSCAFLAFWGLWFWGLWFWDPVGQLLARPLEARFSATEPRGQVAGIIALGGHLARDIEAIKLAKRYPDAKVVASVRGDPYAVYILRSQEFLNGRLILESDSRNTYENAAIAASLVHPKAEERWIIITSGPHMPRAVGVFRKAGFTVHPWPIVYESDRGRLSLIETDCAAAIVGRKIWAGLWRLRRSSSPAPQASSDSTWRSACSPTGARFSASTMSTPMTIRRNFPLRPCSLLGGVIR